MTIETKFNVGDKCFTLDVTSMKAVEFEVGEVAVRFDGTTTWTHYYDKNKDKYSSTSYQENRVFATKDELMAFINRAE